MSFVAHKLEVPNSIIDLNQTPIFVWYVVG